MTNKLFRVFLGLLATTMLASTAFAGSTNLLSDPGFESLDTSGGDVGCTGTLGGWNCFNNAFASSQAVAPHGGNNAAKAWGADGGLVQTVAATAGITYDASVFAINWNGDAFTNLALLELSFQDAGGTNIGPTYEAFCGGPASGQACILNGMDGGDPSMWTAMAVSGLAPAGTVSATFLLLHIDIGLGGGSIFWDDASLTAVPVPAAILLMGPALLGLMGFRRKRA